jgi:hypothetical protein
MSIVVLVSMVVFLSIEVFLLMVTSAFVFGMQFVTRETKRRG